MSEWYQEDLAYIHDVGYGDYAKRSMPGILEILHHHQIADGLVVDLGCGSGISAQVLVEAGYRVLGIDISPAMIDIAKNRVPQAEFQVNSLFQVEIPLCHAVISISECLNYLFNPKLKTEFDADVDIENYSASICEEDDRTPLTRLFHRVYQALTPGGVFIFDLAEPGQVPSGTPTRSFTEGDDWVVLVEKTEDPEKAILTRRIVSFRQVETHYRRSVEIHRQRLYAAEGIANDLQQAGFQVEIIRGYGQYALPDAHAAFVACKSSLDQAGCIQN